MIYLLLPFMQGSSFLNKAGHAIRDLEKKKKKIEEEDCTWPLLKD